MRNNVSHDKSELSEVFSFMKNTLDFSMREVKALI